MNDLHQALGDIRSIRRQLAASTQFRGYGPLALAATGILALLAAGAQALWLPNPAQHIMNYMGIWIGTAALSSALIGAHAVTRSRRMHSGMADEMIRMAAEQFLPSVGTGALVTVVLVHSVPSALWLLPGLWQIIFSLGVFASCRFLPRPIIASGLWYLLTGLSCLSLADARALSPWTMGVAFGAGQFLLAGVLFRSAQQEESMSSEELDQIGDTR